MVPASPTPLYRTPSPITKMSFLVEIFPWHTNVLYMNGSLFPGGRKGGGGGGIFFYMDTAKCTIGEQWPGW